ncbi:DUF2961 domain-containing protein [Bifidobacterium sp. ESL0784]|uniref:DUF2961 domain-containing protein n=1 Tax=Bifidobacterium sp. ESL0784 TaxID=2983231 RepID=UPI0023F764A3|nr:DUF2961 domain-containing protein [Bifidobacterium sp. ESL0784]MDF7640110.1 DUF2961 domain-containing protein [Bifidobacterium sp. ESL0784]
MNGLKISHFSSRLGGKSSVTIFDEAGPTLVKSINISLPPYGPSVVQAQRIAVYVDDNDVPIVDVPILDFAGLTHGRIASMVTHYAECSGSAVTLRWPMSSPRRMRIVITNGDAEPIPLAVLISYQKIWSGYYVSAVLAHREPKEGGLVSVRLPENALDLLGLVVAVRPSDLEWCGEGKIFLGDEVLADGLDMLGGTCLDTSQWFGSDRGISVSVRFDSNVRGHEFLGLYRWFPDGLEIKENANFKIEQVGRQVSVNDGIIKSKRVPREDEWDILLVTTHQNVPDISGYDFSLSEIDNQIWYRDYEESSFREHIWSSIRMHVKTGGRGSV